MIFGELANTRKKEDMAVNKQLIQNTPCPNGAHWD
jgi:hypothetical protein